MINHLRPPRPPRPRGFSLIELMVVLAIFAIVLGLAVPTYQNHAERGRRVVAMSALYEIAARQEQYYLQHLQYTTDINDLPYPAHTADNAYTLTVSAGNAQSFIAEAKINANGRQASDSECVRFLLHANGKRQAFAASDDNDDENNDASTQCWR